MLCNPTILWQDNQHTVWPVGKKRKNEIHIATINQSSSQNWCFKHEISCLLHHTCEICQSSFVLTNDCNKNVNKRPILNLSRASFLPSWNEKKKSHVLNKSIFMPILSQCCLFCFCRFYNLWGHTSKGFCCCSTNEGLSVFMTFLSGFALTLKNMFVLATQPN